MLRRRTGGLDGHQVVRHYVRLVAAAVPAGVAGLGGGLGWSAGPLGDGFGGSVASLAAGGLVLLAIFLGVARALHVEELDALLARVRPGTRA